MNILLDTHLLLWQAINSKRLSKTAKDLMDSKDNALFFSPASLWEIVIKNGLGRQDFQINASVLRRGLIDNDYTELLISADHALSVGLLPYVHKDPFDRILIAQANFEGLVFLTTDKQLEGYANPVRLV